MTFIFRESIDMHRVFVSNKKRINFRGAIERPASQNVSKTQISAKANQSNIKLQKNGTQKKKHKRQKGRHLIYAFGFSTISIAASVLFFFLKTEIKMMQSWDLFLRLSRPADNRTSPQMGEKGQQSQNKKISRLLFCVWPRKKTQTVSRWREKVDVRFRGRNTPVLFGSKEETISPSGLAPFSAAIPSHIRDILGEMVDLKSISVLMFLFSPLWLTH